MTAQVYRMYRGDKAEDTYVFSIVASEREARFVVPSTDLETQEVFNQERIRELMLGVEPDALPKTPEEWAILAAYNAGRSMNLFPVEGATSPDFDFLVEEEQEYADANAEKYAYLKGDI